MTLVTDLYLVEPDWFRGTVDDMWQLRHQVSSFCEPLVIDSPYVFTALSALGELTRGGPSLAERIPNCDPGAFEAFGGLAPGARAEQNAACVFDCKAPEPDEEQSIHCATVSEMAVILPMCAELLEHFEDADVGGLLSSWATPEAVRAVLKALAGATPDNVCLVGWSYGGF